MDVQSSRWNCLLLSFLSVVGAGCTVYPPRVSGYPTGVAPAQHRALQQQHTNLAARFHELNQRAAGLDADNQRLQALLAQQQQQSAQLQAALRGSRDKVADLRDDLTAERRSKEAYAGQGSVPAEEVGFSAGGTLPLASISGAEVSQDGQAVRIRLDGAKLFASGKASIVNSSANSKLLDDVVVALRRNYTGRRITIEGHTDSDPIRRSRWKNNQQLSQARAEAIYHALRRRGVPEQLLTVAGYGASRPVADNSTKAGKARNRRVEIVVHP